ncbi:YdcF family protein [Flaviaesturariibacter terrae]
MFVLLKVILWFFRPLIWVIVLFAWGLLTKKPLRKRRLIGAAFGLLLFFSNPAIINALYRAYEPNPVALEQAGQYSAGIVLGGFVNYNQKDDAGYFNSASDRFIQAALLYKTGHLRKLIIPAGNGYIVEHGFQEATFAKEKLVQLGIPEGDIYTDVRSRNTLENAQNTKHIIDSLQLKGPFLLISSAAHLPRARPVFEKLGVPVELFPCDFISRGVGNNLFEDYLLPQSTALRNWDSFIKEILGVITYRITGKG